MGSKNGKSLALIEASVNNEMYINIENSSDAWTYLRTFKDLFDTQPE